MTRSTHMALLLLASFWSKGAAGQSTEITGRPTCPSCTIRFDHILDIGDEKGNGMIESELSFVTTDSRGRFYVIHPYGTEIRIFGPDGRFIRILGRKGGGPGEFEGIAGVKAGRGDSLYVLDNTQSRLSVFGPAYEYARSAPLALSPQMQSVLLGTGEVVVNLDSRSPSHAGLPLHLLGHDGSVKRSFGSQTRLLRPDIPGLTSRVLAPSRTLRAGLWSGHERAYIIEHWDAASSELQQRVVRKVDWFPSGEVPRTRPWNGVTDPPEPSLVQVHENADGMLWVMLSLPDPRWKSAVRARTHDHIDLIDGTRYTDAMVEVLDPRRRVVVASVRMDAFPGYFINDGMAAGAPIERNGRVVIPVYRVSLVVP